MRARAGWILAGAAILAAGAAVAWRAGWLAPRPPRRNVVLISIDSLRADHLGCYGHRPEFAPEQPFTPHLDALAAEGAAFDSAWSTTSWTLPSHMAILTGLSDRLHGVEQDDKALAPERLTLGERFQAAGWTTAGFYSGPYLDPKYGFGRGFDRYESAMRTTEEKEAMVDQWLRRRAGELGPPDGERARRERRFLLANSPHWDVTSPRLNDLALDFLEGADRERPFFLFLHYFDAHYDYLPDLAEPGLAARFDPGYAGSFTGEGWWTTDVVRDPRTGERRISERDLRHAMALYDAEIHWVDRHVGEVLRRLRERGLWEDTIVCVLSDHGDEFFEHGGIGHRSTLYAELTRIPLLLRAPGGPAGLRVRALVRSYDVAPTLLDLAGAPPLPEAEGRSLRPLLAGAQDPPRTVLQRVLPPVGDWRAVAAERPSPPAPMFHDGWRDGRLAVLRSFRQDPEAVDAQGRLIARQLLHSTAGVPLFEVYDAAENPQERAPPLPPRDARYRQALAAFCRDFLACERRAEVLRGEARYAPPMSEEEIERMRQLGYAGEATGAEPVPPFAPLPSPCGP